MLCPTRRLSKGTRSRPQGTYSTCSDLCETLEAIVISVFCRFGPTYSAFPKSLGLCCVKAKFEYDD